MLQYFFIHESEMAEAGLSPCGVFSPTHILVTVVCLCAIAGALYATRRVSEKTLYRITGIIACFTAVLECGKIAFNFLHGATTPNNWLPLTFCSFAIYAYAMIAFGRGRVRDVGIAFMTGGGIIAGLTFLLFPLTSVATYPMFHFLSLYSMLYHSFMMYVGLSFVLRGKVHFTLSLYRRYLLFTLPACLFALVVNLGYALLGGDITLCNMMFLVYPYRLSDIAPFIGVVYQAAPIVYTGGVLAVYLTVPFFVPYGLAKWGAWLRRTYRK